MEAIMSDEDRLAVLREQAQAALDTLPMDQRAAYLLSALDGLDQAAVAFRLGLTVEQVQTALAAALVAIDRQLRRGLFH
jgi:DNA-directed RNA polymerase specialized sigma24 family protein